MERGQVALYDPSSDKWREWELPGTGPRAYEVFVDTDNLVWLSDFGKNSVVSFDPIDPKSEGLVVYDLPISPSNIRQILGRAGEVSLPESAADQIEVISY